GGPARGVRARLLPLGMGAAAPGHGPHGCGGAHPRRADLGREARHAAHDGPGAPRERRPAAPRARPRARARRLPWLVRGGDHLRRPRADGVRAGASADAGGVCAADPLMRLGGESRKTFSTDTPVSAKSVTFLGTTV